MAAPQQRKTCPDGWFLLGLTISISDPQRSHWSRKPFLSLVGSFRTLDIVRLLRGNGG
jgi:hypothetical protein